MSTIRSCNVCVVGGAGFLGSHLVDYLVEERGCQVLVVDNLVVGRREFIHRDAEFLHHDITGSEDYLREAFIRRKIDYVFNYAAWPYIPDSFARPLHVFNVNATAAIKVINAAHEAGCKGMLQVSSAEIYGDGQRGHYRATNADEWGKDLAGQINEEGAVRPHSTYGCAKAAVDYYCQSAWRERRTPVIALRQFNCLGPRDILHPYIAPEVITQLATQIGNPVGRLKLGNNSFRDFMYAGDAVRMAVELLEAEAWGEVFNLGSEQGIRIYDFAKLIGRCMGFDEVEIVQESSRMRHWEIWHLHACNDKIYSVVSARPTVSLEESVRRMVEDLRSRGWKYAW